MKLVWINPLAGIGLAQSTEDWLSEIYCLSGSFHNLSFNIAEKRGRCMGARGFSVFKKLKKLKWKRGNTTQMRRVTMVMLYLHFSRDCIILSSVTKLRWQMEYKLLIYREMQNKTRLKNKTSMWVCGFYFILIMVAWGPMKLIAKNFLWIPKNCMSDWKITSGHICSGPSSNHGRSCFFFCDTCNIVLCSNCKLKLSCIPIGTPHFPVKNNIQLCICGMLYGYFHQQNWQGHVLKSPNQSCETSVFWN